MNNQKKSQILFVAFLFRFILLLIDQFWFRLPQGGADTEYFDFLAKDMNNSPYSYSFLEIISSGALLFAYFGSIIYKLFGNEPFVWAFIMLLLGVGTVNNVYNGAYLITGNKKIASRSAWVVCLFPNLAVLSVLVLREAPIHFFSTLALVYLVKYIKNKNLINIVFFFLLAIIASIWHSAMFMFLFGGLVYITFFQKSNPILKIVVIIMGIGLLLFINSTGLGLSKFGGSFEEAVNKIDSGFEGRGNAIYPSWMIMSGGLSDLWKLPIRMVAFLFAPFFPFMVKSASHLLGLLDGVFYFVIVYNIFKNRKITYKLFPIIKLPIVITIVVVIGFSFGASNFGTNIRHRAKVLPILLFCPYMTKNNIKKIKRLNRYGQSQSY